MQHSQPCHAPCALLPLQREGWRWKEQKDLLGFSKAFPQKTNLLLWSWAAECHPPFDRIKAKPAASLLITEDWPINAHLRNAPSCTIQNQRARSPGRDVAADRSG